MSAHTPGPWIVEDDKHGILVLAEGAGLSVSVTIPGRKITAEDKANARLIAAAPELLAALEEITAGLDESSDTMPLIRGAEVKAARAAIAKARGKA